MNRLWESALNDIKARISEENFETWFAPIEFRDQRDDLLVLAIPNKFYADWIDSHYLATLLESIKQNANKALSIEWIVDDRLQEASLKQHEPSAPPPPAPPRRATPTPNIRQRSSLNPKYSFDNFVVGPSNQLGYAASMSAASGNGKRGNPLFIYGGVGLGKTHLVNAVGHRFLSSKQNARVLYLSAECFTNEFIWSLQNGEMDAFRNRYRNECDLLLMDDIQFLAGREQTQEEFFHTFNALYHLDKQIVVTSDVPPKQISGMQERLISRFQWGLVADIQAPELDTRIAILRTKAQQENIILNDDVALFIGQSVKSNVRELEGTLLRLAVKADLLHRSIDLDFAKESLRSLLPSAEQATTVEDIQKAACEYFGIKLSELKSHRRHRAIALPRMIAMYLCRQRLGTSFPELGERFGGKDHTTVMSAVRKITKNVDTDAMVRDAVENIERKLGL
ncbi:MAG: chromosomal replication initiator protein DnaA [Myxococcales bacterium]|nr:MAG: chromosomal replication initiator protein DnaA [Myxococcales bacterium]